jgi:hypothetical protein
LEINCVSYDERCADCLRLMKDLADATNAHLKLLNDQQVASIGQDSAVLESLTQALVDAAARRQFARELFRTHTSGHTPENV